MFSSDCAFASSSESDSASWALQNDVEVHAENTGEWIILNSEIDMLLNSESEAASIREILFLELSIFDFQASLEDLIGFITSHCYMDCNLLVSLDAEASNCEACT